MLESESGGVQEPQKRDRGSSGTPDVTSTVPADEAGTPGAGTGKQGRAGL